MVSCAPPSPGLARSKLTGELLMKPVYRVLAAWAALGVVPGLMAAEADLGGSPADHLPAHISRATWFGERADWSHDGKRILFLSKTFGDAMEIDLATKVIRNLTAHYAHAGEPPPPHFPKG